MGLNSVFELRKFVAPEFLFGKDAVEMTESYVKNLGAKKVMIVTDPGVIQAGWSPLIEKRLKNSGVAYIVFSDVTPNPRDYEVMAGSEICRKEGCDLIIAVGGGSPMDCAKGIGIVTTNRTGVLEFEGVDEVLLPGLPLICIPTTAGTSADISQFSIILDTERKVKIAIISKTVVPDISLIDPAVTVTMDSCLTAATGIDALVHAFEAYVSNAFSPVTDLNAIEAVKIIRAHLKGAIDNPHDMVSRGNMMLGSMLAGLAFSNASLGLVHAMAHSLGGLLDLPHGECNAILLDRVVDYNFNSAAEKYTKLAGAMGIDTQGCSSEKIKKLLIEEIASFRHEAGITSSLSGFGVTGEMIANLAENALNDPCAVTNPREPHINDIAEIYEKCI